MKIKLCREETSENKVNRAGNNDKGLAGRQFYPDSLNNGIGLP